MYCNIQPFFFFSPSLKDPYTYTQMQTVSWISLEIVLIHLLWLKCKCNCFDHSLQTGFKDIPMKCTSYFQEKDHERVSGKGISSQDRFVIFSDWTGITVVLPSRKLVPFPENKGSDKKVHVWCLFLIHHCLQIQGFTKMWTLLPVKQITPEVKTQPQIYQQKEYDHTHSQTGIANAQMIHICYVHKTSVRWSP